MKEKNKPFKILSIDGGGNKGVFPAKFLTSIEEEIGEGQIHKYFNIITGTSTGGIIALALSLGVPAKEILALYQDNAKTIFGKMSWCIFRKPFYSNKPLEKLIRTKFKAYNKDKDPIINDAKVNLLIPIYNLVNGATQVLKTPHAQDLHIDKHIPMYMAAMATSAAPTFFNAYSNTYKKENTNVVESFSNKIDGGVFANNPSMLAIIEAQTRFNKDLSQIELLSLGTGQKLFSNAKNKNKWSVGFWIWKKRIIESFMQSQSQIVHNSVAVLDKFNTDFKYKRIDLKFDENFNVKMDETDKNKLDKLVEKSATIFQNERSNVLDTYFSSSISTI